MLNLNYRSRYVKLIPNEITTRPESRDAGQLSRMVPTEARRFPNVLKRSSIV